MTDMHSHMRSQLGERSIAQFLITKEQCSRESLFVDEFPHARTRTLHRHRSRRFHLRRSTCDFDRVAVDDERRGEGSEGGGRGVNREARGSDSATTGVPGGAELLKHQLVHDETVETAERVERKL